MEQQSILLRETAKPAELAAQAIAAVTEGDIDPIVAYLNISRMAKAIEIFKANARVVDIVLRERAKYPQQQRFGDCTLEEVEGGVRYDFSACNDARLEGLYAMRKSLDADIKEREAMLKALPASGLANPETGEILYPPVRTSKTTIKTTFIK